MASRPLSAVQAPPTDYLADDITYGWTWEGWVYLAVILDLHSRRVIALRDLHANLFRVTSGQSATAWRRVWRSAP